MRYIKNIVVKIIFLALTSMSCKIATMHATTFVESPVLIDEVDKGWLRFSLYAIKDTLANRSQDMLYSIRVINISDNNSPLRKISKNLDEYNTAYAYLLTQAKNDFVLYSNNSVFYPSYYAIENHYNSFPFETINIGYSIKKEKKKGDRLIAFIDRVFTQDTIVFNLTPKKYITKK
jgi:hypothetical protein